MAYNILMKNADPARPLILFRCWKIINTESGLRLAAAADGSLWKEGINCAYCRYSKHDAPGNKCHCGLNGFYSLPTDQVLNKSSSETVWGIIASVGNLRMHKLGARSSEAQILALFIPDFLKGDRNYVKEIKTLAEAYSVPWFTDKDELIEYGKTHGSIIESKPINDYKVLRNIVGAYVLNTENAGNTGTNYSSEDKNQYRKKVWMSLSATLFAIFILFGTTILLWSGLYEMSYINLFGNIKPSIIGVLSLPIGMIVYSSIFFFIIDKVGVDFERSKFGIDVSPYFFLGILGICVLVAPISGFLMIQSKKEKTVQQLDKAAKVLNQDIKTILNFQEETYHKTGKLPEQIKDLDLNKDASKILSYTSIYNTFDLQIKPEVDHVFEKIKVIGKPGKASFECLSKNSGFCEQVFKPGLAFQPGVGEKGTCLKTIREKTNKDHLTKGTILSELTSEVECSNKVF